MRKIFAILFVVSVCSVLLFGGDDDAKHADQSVLKQKLAAKQTTLEFIDQSLWDQIQKAESKVPAKNREDFRSLMRTMFTEENEQKSQEATKAFRVKAFPGASDEKAFEWAFHLKGTDELTPGYRLLLEEIDALKKQIR